MTGTVSKAVILVALHGGPADHFATFAEGLAKKGYEVQVYGSGPALKKFQDRKIEGVRPISQDNLSMEEETALANQLAERCSRALAVITDVGHPFDIKLQRSFASRAPSVLRLAYYDNPEPYVPGGYSTVAAEVMQLAEKVLFANANLAQDPIYTQPDQVLQLSLSKRVGMGYYPIDQAEKIAKRRAEEYSVMRAKLLRENGLRDTGQKVLVYFGGNNEEYFTQAFPAFLRILIEAESRGELSNWILVMQQHPGAKAKNLDGAQLEEQLKRWRGAHEGDTRVITPILSKWTSDEVQIAADVALYYQTSMGPQFALAGIPTIQIGHKPYEDILVRNHLCPSVTNVSEFLYALAHLDHKARTKGQQELIYRSLGIRSDWLQILERALQQKPDRRTYTITSAIPFVLASVGLVIAVVHAARLFKAS